LRSAPAPQAPTAPAAVAVVAALVQSHDVPISLRGVRLSKKPDPPQCRPVSFLHCVPPYGYGFRACLEAQRWPSATP